MREGVGRMREKTSWVDCGIDETFLVRRKRGGS
jgi:hypothetical protein